MPKHSGNQRKPRTVLLKGYYGFGNLGDDLLLLAIAQIARSRFPEATISVFANAIAAPEIVRRDPNYRDYIIGLLGPDVKLVDWRDDGQFDLTIHGGGGVFFSVGQGPVTFRSLATIAMWLGAPVWGMACGLIRAVSGRPHRLKATREVALGVGLGPFHGRDRRLLMDIESLSKLDRIAVRDCASFKEAQRLGLSARTSVFTDLAFSLQIARPRRRAGPPRVGIVICDGKPFSELLADFIALPSHTGFRPILLDENTDERLARTLSAAGHHPLIYRPKEQDPVSFCKELAAYELVVTNRAHGAIAASLVGVPSIVIASDPKLRSIHELLPKGSLLLEPRTVVDVGNAIRDALTRKAELQAGLRTDVACQRALVEPMIEFCFGRAAA